MDHLALRERELEVDLESGGTTSEEDGANDQVSANRQTNRTFDWVWTGHFSIDGSVNGKCGMNLYSNSPNFSEAVNKNAELLDKNSGDESKENVAPLEKKSVEGNCNKANSRKPTKPPRPPKGPSLDAADQKLVREIAELAMRKRVRIERIKALKKMKAAKASNFYSLCSGSSGSVGMHGSPAPAVTGSESLISIQFYRSFSAHESNGPGLGSVNAAKGQVSSSGSEE